MSKQGRGFTQNAKHDYTRILRQFILWMIGEGYSNISEKKIRDIKVPAVDTSTTRPDEIITVDEIDRMLKACKHSRDRALIAVFYESGCRVGELARFTWKDMAFDEHGVKCYITDTKSSKRRYARLTMAHHALAAWKADSPDTSPDAPVFISLKDQSPVTYLTVTRLIIRTQRAAGIEKKLHPHLFRKSRITHMISQNFQESVVKQSMWANLDTKMFKTYVCLAEDDIDDEFLAKAGVRRKKTPEENPLAPRPCPHCHYVNGPGMSFCGKCGASLTKEVQDTQDDLMKILSRKASDDPEGLIKALKELGGN